MTSLLAARIGGAWAGALAAILMATLPPLIAHASLATTDVAFVAGFLLALLTLSRWRERPTLGRTLAFGGSVGALAFTKFSALLLFPAAAAIVALHWRGPRLPRLLTSLDVATSVAALLIWGGYRFSGGPVVGPSLPPQMGGYTVVSLDPERRGLEGLLTGLWVPAPEFLHGLLMLRAHQAHGHEAYLLGEVRSSGFWTYYPLAPFFKAPLPFLLLVSAGIGMLAVRRRQPSAEAALGWVLAALAVLAVLSASRINIGVRHALVVYPLLAVPAAVGLCIGLAKLTGRRRSIAAAAIAGLLAVQQATVLAATPNQLSFFNVLAGKDPGRLLVDSDIDWGQGLLLLADEARRRGIAELNIALFGSHIRACQHGLPPLTALVPHQPVTGWVAISEGFYHGFLESWAPRSPCDPLSAWAGMGFSPGYFRWLRAYEPVWRGGGIRLYRITTQ